MKFRLSKLEDISGSEASFYSPIIGNSESTLFEEFLDAYEDDYQEEIDDIVGRLLGMSKETGARKQFFEEREGKPTDGIHKLRKGEGVSHDLRLYVIHFSRGLVILGGGGPKSVRTYQEDPNLYEMVKRLQAMDKQIMERKKDGDLSIGYLEFEGDLEFNDDLFEDE